MSDVFSAAYESVAGALDHAAGSSDEAVGRFVDDASEVADSRDASDPERRLGPLQRATGYSRLFVRHTLGSGAENVAFETPGGSFAGQEDTASVLGPSVWGEGSLADAAVNREGETHSAREWRSRIWLLVIVLAVLAYLLGPVLGFFDALLSGGDS